jgi:hypothetical protein
MLDKRNGLFFRMLWNGYLGVSGCQGKVALPESTPTEGRLRYYCEEVIPSKMMAREIF